MSGEWHGWRELEPGEVDALHRHAVLSLFGTEAGWRRVMQCIRLLGESAVFGFVQQGLEAELGRAVARRDSAEIHDAVRSARRLHELLVELVLLERGQRRFNVTGPEHVACRVVRDALLRLLAEMERLEGVGLRELAEVGAGLELLLLEGGAVGFPSLTAALWDLACSLFDGLGGKEDGIAQREGRKRGVRRPQVGRPAPATSSAMELDDRAFLPSAFEGKRVAKDVASRASELCGLALDAGFARKRKGDLIRWKLLEDTKPWAVTARGDDWAREISFRATGAPPRAAGSASDDGRRSGPKDAR